MARQHNNRFSMLLAKWKYIKQKELTVEKVSQKLSQTKAKVKR